MNPKADTKNTKKIKSKLGQNSGVSNGGYVMVGKMQYAKKQGKKG